MKTEILLQRRWKLGVSHKEEPRNLTDVTCDIMQLTPLYLRVRNHNPSQEQGTEWDEQAFWKTLNIKLD